MTTVIELFRFYAYKNGDQITIENVTNFKKLDDGTHQIILISGEHIFVAPGWQLVKIVPVEGVASEIEKPLFEKLVPDATLPVRATEGAAGYDLYPLVPYTLQNNSFVSEIVKMRTGIKVNVPEGHCAQIWCRSGVGSKGGFIHGGLIDRDYQKELMVMMSNLGHDEIVFPISKAFAQLLIVPCLMVGSVSSVRTGGFGSTDTATAI